MSSSPEPSKAKPAKPLPSRLHVNTFGEHFSVAAVRDSLDHLNDIDNVTESLRTIRQAKLPHPDRDASVFWDDLHGLIVSTETQAIFCTEDEVVDLLSGRAIRRLTIDYQILFQRAGFANAKQAHVFELLRDARSRQITAGHGARLRRDTALAAVLAMSTPNMRLWTSALQNLLQAQRACPSSPLQKGQIRDHLQLAVAIHYSHLAADPIWMTPDTESKPS
ncbi:hypothetical protein SEPCBS57363_003150 [Sporothrix epigloea]|uniref:Uncharacterized protein n=1 Tax=Sporothrix epigloea TaxID=1892477 RepID=A0ABP0DMM8_9PEZI